MALTSADGATVFKTDIIPNPTFRADSTTNPTTQAAFALGDMWQRIGNVQASVSTLATANSAMGKQITALIATVNMISQNADVDTEAIIAAINAVGTQESDQLIAAQAQISALQAEVDELKQLLESPAGGGVPQQPGAPAAETTDSADF